jgi:hypothetical protein
MSRVSGAWRRGATIFAYLLAIIEPVTRTVCCKLPRTALTVRTTVDAAGFGAGDRQNQRAAAAMAIEPEINSHPLKRERSGAGGGGADSLGSGAGWGAAADFSVAGTEKLL